MSTTRNHSPHDLDHAQFNLISSMLLLHILSKYRMEIFLRH